jgi:hypothetical protein
MRTAWIALAASLSLAAAGCKSALINATVSNHRNTPISLVELDYPSASFGIQKLEPGQDYHYRFKVIGNGPATVLWSEGKDQKKNSGPVLREGDAGNLSVTFTDSPNPTWDTRLTNRVVP